jgi:methyl-accepting chemotaxis protein
MIKAEQSQRIGFKHKLLWVFLLVSLLPLSGLGLFLAQQSGEALSTQAREHLQTIRESKKSTLHIFFDGLRNQILATAQSNLAIRTLNLEEQFHRFRKDNHIDTAELARQKKALRHYYQDSFPREYRKRNSGHDLPDMDDFLNQLDADTIALQYAYMVTNTYSLAEKLKLNRTSDVSTYSQEHALYHNELSAKLEAFNFYDIFIVDPEGDVVYSVFKEIDFATNLVDGPLADSGIGRVFRRAIKAGLNSVVIEDYTSYLPSYHDPSMFIAAPIFDQGQQAGVIIVQISTKTINQIMQVRDGMGESGETILVGSDYLMRSDSHLEPQFHSVSESFNFPDRGRVDTIATRTVFEQGRADVYFAKDYRQQDTIIAATPIKIDHFVWSLNVKMDVAEIMAPVHKLQLTIIVVFFVVAILVILVSMRIVYGVMQLESTDMY